MAETGQETRPSDRAIFGLCELLGLVFALPFGEDLYRGTPVALEHVIYLIVGAVFAVVGPMWPRLRAFMPEHVAGSVSQAATDFRWWLGILLALYVVISARPINQTWSIGVAIGFAMIVLGIVVATWRRNTKMSTGVFLDRLNIIGENLETFKRELTTELERLNGRIESNQRQISMNYGILSGSLHARDAEHIIKEADKQVREMAKKLLNTAYEDGDEWQRDYVRWERAISQIDGCMLQWSEHYTKFLSVNANDLENAPMPPQFLKSYGAITHYKTLWLVQQSYANRRDDVLIFIETKTRLP